MSKLLPPAKNTAPYPMAQNVLNSLALQSWYQGCSQEEALNRNANLATNYLNVTFHDWLTNYDAGRVDGGNPSAPPPQPPNGFMVEVQDDGITCDMVESGPPVCGLPSYALIPAPQTLQQAQNMLMVLGGNAATAASQFTRAEAVFGTPIVAPDGSRWVRVS